MVVYQLCFLLKLGGRIETGNKDAIEHKYDNELTIDDKYTTELYATMYSISQEICTRFLLCCALSWLYIDWFSHIHQAYFTGTVAI